MSILNRDCLEHISEFLEPKDWLSFTQVCKLWKLAATSKQFQKFEFWSLCDEVPSDERLSFIEFMDILKIIAPKITYAKIGRYYKDERMDERNTSVCIPVALGRFKFVVQFTEQQEDVLMNVFVKQTKNVKTLKIRSFDGATKQDWEKFFQVNQVTNFGYYNDDNNLFFDYINILPHTVEQFGLKFYVKSGGFYYDSEIDETDENKLLLLIQEYLEKLPRISKLFLEHELGFILPRIATVLAKQANNITHLTLLHESTYDSSDQLANVYADRVNKQDEEILSAISGCTNLTTLILNFTIRDENLCEQIVKNCQSIRYLDLSESDFVSENCLRLLMSLPNLEELKMGVYKITIRKEMKKLETLEIWDHNIGFHDWDNLAGALVFMPSLSSLKLFFLSETSMTETTGRTIKETIHSRGQNIVFYLENNRKVAEIAEIPCNAPGPQKEFSIFCINEDALKFIFPRFL